MAPSTGSTTWFCCGAAWGPCGSTGKGACGTCNSASMQCAWPNASAACFDITRPDKCGKTLVRRTCGYQFTITSLCNNKAVRVKIADCGPQTDLWCGEKTCCGTKCGTNRIMDLTPAAYSVIGSLSGGRLPCTVA